MTWPGIWIGRNTFEITAFIRWLSSSGYSYKHCEGPVSWISWPHAYSKASLKLAEGDTDSSLSPDWACSNRQKALTLHPSPLQRDLALPPAMMIAERTHWLGLPQCKPLTSLIWTTIDCKSASIANYTQAPSQLHGRLPDAGEVSPPWFCWKPPRNLRIWLGYILHCL